MTATVQPTMLPNILLDCKNLLTFWMTKIDGFKITGHNKTHLLQKLAVKGLCNRAKQNNIQKKFLNAQILMGRSTKMSLKINFQCKKLFLKKSYYLSFQLGAILIPILLNLDQYWHSNIILLLQVLTMYFETRRIAVILHNSSWNGAASVCLVYQESLECVFKVK